MENLLTYQYQGLEFSFAKKLYRLYEKGKLEMIVREDQTYTSMLTFVYAKASRDMGRNYLRQLEHLSKQTVVKDYFSAVKSGQSAGNEVAVLSAYAFELGMEVETFLLLWSKKNLINIAAAALKISRIRPSEVQVILFAFDETLEASILEAEPSFNNFNPLFEETIFQHKSIEPKMFMT